MAAEHLSASLTFRKGTHLTLTTHCIWLLALDPLSQCDFQGTSGTRMQQGFQASKVSCMEEMA